jgi:hypothetical protein
VFLDSLFRNLLWRLWELWSSSDIDCYLFDSFFLVQPFKLQSVDVKVFKMCKNLFLTSLEYNELSFLTNLGAL